MKDRRLTVIFTSIIVLILLLSACSKSDETAEVVTTEAAGGETAPATTQEVQTTNESKPTGVPEDVPIMPDAYDLSVPNQLNISYKIALPITDVVTFYQGELPNYGWDAINNPDSVIGSMAQLSRANAAGDRLIFSLQYNSIGQFSVVQIYITRAP